MGDLERMIGRLSKEARMIMPDGAILDRREIDELQAALRLAFSDWRCELVHAVQSGDTLVAELRWSGRHDGPFCTGVNLLPPTGAQVSYRSCDVFVVRDGEVVEWRCYFDPAALFGDIAAAA